MRALGLSRVMCNKGAARLHFTMVLDGPALGFSAPPAKKRKSPRQGQCNNLNANHKSQECPLGRPEGPHEIRCDPLTDAQSTGRERQCVADDNEWRDAH